jgi:hypothetical protein
MTNTVAIAGDGTDFYVLDRGGKVAAFGAAKGLGGLDTTGDRNAAADLAVSPTTNGYWIVTEPGGIWAFGGATWYGSPSKSSNTAGVTSVRLHPTPSGHGYWVLGSDGRMRGYGDAVFFGSPASQGVCDAVDFWPTPSGKGYWVLTASGRVLSFGDATAKGDLTSRKSWSKPAVAILGAGTGYLIVTSDGGVYAYGDVPYYGSIAGSGLKPVAIAPAFR